ncbi:trypsin-like serine protease [Deinococcus cellulosilyticus]|uniref:Peptidase S1 domain-containing protein n=1 Tax=Deinococcus cellulosilyticus (strain DSM 18568 / NBRC 106333 / KACC 11606 / 5516J-15) TaxID=1223518 RepID=A0A511N694_DEIC1|nr:trypsin-like serine protease [Deinococcus cellulosilyticus]GEM47978.1 hypothetical protein DC3_36130 [Deinococcus cellulosilyticus NBRC 106333 = KACC 11606]
MKIMPFAFSLVSLLLCSVAGARVGGGSIPTASSPIAPSMVALVDVEGTLCSGVLIGNNTVLTAAHCVEDMMAVPSPIVYFPQPGEIIGHDQKALMVKGRFLIPKQILRTPERSSKVSLGRFPTPGKKVVDFKKEMVYQGPDLALLEVDAGAVRSWTGFKKAILPFNQESDELNPGESIKVAGFGIYEFHDREPSGQLHEGTEEVAAFGLSPVGTFVIQPSATGGARACAGDSGGGVFALRNGQWVLSGIISAATGTEEQAAKFPPGSRMYRICQEASYTEIVDVLQYGKFIAQAARWDTAIAEWVRESERKRAPLVSNFQADAAYLYHLGEQCAVAFEKKKFAEALGPCTTAAQGRVDSSQYLLGRMYWEGTGVTRNLSQSALWMEKAARQNFGPAWYVLAFWYEQGTGPYTINPQKASESYQKCAQLQVQECINRLKALQGK